MSGARLPQIGSKLPPRIGLSHGSGGRDMHLLLNELVFPVLGLDAEEHNDQAQIALSSLTEQGDRLAFTTDSYTVDPLIFPGGDIGSLAVYGTVNDLAVGGAKPLFLSCGLIIEEGFETATLKQLLVSLRRAADEAGVRILTGDTKVVHRGSVDGLFINTSGIGVISQNVSLSPAQIVSGDIVLVSGPIGDHGAAILGARGDLNLDVSVESDCKSLHGVVSDLLSSCDGVRFMRDATRGGISAVLNEFSQAANVGISIVESDVPMRARVRGACEILGLDPLYLANEGTLVAIVSAEDADAALSVMHRHDVGAAVIGKIVDRHPGVVAMTTGLGGERVLDMPAGELLPRIC